MRRRKPDPVIVAESASTYTPPGYSYARIVRDGLEVRLEYRPAAATGIEAREVCELDHAMDLSEAQLRAWAAARIAIDLSSAEQLEIVDL